MRDRAAKVTAIQRDNIFAMFGGYDVDDDTHDHPEDSDRLFGVQLALIRCN